jgi:hypothetical protein
MSPISDNTASLALNLFDVRGGKMQELLAIAFKK